MHNSSSIHRDALHRSRGNRKQKTFFANWRLGTRLIVAIAGTSLLVLMLATIILAPIELEKFKHNRLFQGRVIMDAYAVQFVQMVQLNTAEQAVNMSSQLAGFPSLLSLSVDNIHGQRIFTYTGEHPNAEDNLFNLQPFVIKQPLSYLNKDYGRVGITISAKGYEAAIMPYLGVGSSLVIGLFLLALLVAQRLKFHIGGPIVELAEVLEHSELDNKHKLKIDSSQPPEIKVLYEGFNQFINTITKTQNALLEQKQALDVSAIVSISDTNGKITYANELFYQSMGYQEHEVIGKNHRLMNSGHHDDVFFANLWQTINAGKVWRGEICNRSKNGMLRWHNTTIVPFFNEGKLYQFLAIRFDISEQKTLENILITTREKAEYANQAKSDFLSSMSHELRTPLNAILGFAQLLEMDALETDVESALSHDQKENVDHIIAAGTHLLTLINEILELSAIEAGQIELSIESIGLKDIINDTLLLVQSKAAKSNIEVCLLKDADISVQADYTKLKQILLNLISNAIKYNQEDGSVSIDCSLSEDNLVRISIIDTGVGISDKNQHNIFNPFHRLGYENSAIEGTGIGLVVTKNLVELMNGRIGFESVEGKGTTFWFELPMSEHSL